MQEVEVAADVDFEKVAEICKRCSGNYITNIWRDAAMNGMRTLIAGKTSQETRRDHLYFLALLLPYSIMRVTVMNRFQVCKMLL